MKFTFFLFKKKPFLYNKQKILCHNAEINSYQNVNTENEFIMEKILNLSHQSLSNFFTIKIYFTYIHKIVIFLLLKYILHIFIKY